MTCLTRPSNARADGASKLPIVLPRKANKTGRGNRSGRPNELPMSATAGVTRRLGYSARSRRAVLARKSSLTSTGT